MRNNSRKKNKRIKKHKKTKKNRNYKKDLLYIKKFKNTKLIPTSEILKYIKNNFDSYRKEKEELSKVNKNVIYLDDCFDFSSLHKSKERIFSFDSPIKGKSIFSLEKLIAYSFYIKTPYLFLDNDNNITTEQFYLETLKYQMGKDIRRDNRSINNIEYTYEVYSNQDLTNFQVCDMFYETIITSENKNNKEIDYNLINKICLLSCQNMFNLITDLVTIKLNDFLKPEVNSVFRPIKNANIIITKENESMEFYFNSQLIISKDGNAIDPEYPCGHLLFKLLFDFKNNSYQFTTFQLNYNINKCGPEEEDTSNNETTINENTKGINIPLKYAVPAALGVGGIVSVPFILGALGGKKEKNSKKKKK